jgi:large subunit ribosomal protein L5
MATRLNEHYDTVLKPKLKEELGYSNDHQVPRLDKIVLNMGIGEAAQDSKKIDSALNEMTLISGQKPVLNRARQSVANFKLREGMPIGCARFPRTEPK